MPPSGATAFDSGSGRNFCGRCLGNTNLGATICYLQLHQNGNHCLGPEKMTVYEKGKRGERVPRGRGGTRSLSFPCRKFLSPEDEPSVFTMDHFPLWYRQAAEQPAGSFVFNLRSAEGPGNPHPVLLGRVEPGLPSSSALRARSRRSRSPSSPPTSS